MAVVEEGPVDYANVNVHSRRGHQLWRVKRSALRLRVIGSVNQPLGYMIR